MDSRWWGSWFWSSAIKKASKQRRTDWTATSSHASYRRRCTSHLARLRRPSRHRGARGRICPLLKAMNLLFGLSLCIQVSVTVVLAWPSRAHTGRTGLSGGGAAWLQKPSRWDVSTPGRRMPHGSATDWRMLSSYVGGGWKAKRDRNRVLRFVAPVYRYWFKMTVAHQDSQIIDQMLKTV